MNLQLLTHSWAKLINTALLAASSLRVAAYASGRIPVPVHRVPGWQIIIFFRQLADYHLLFVSRDAFYMSIRSHEALVADTGVHAFTGFRLHGQIFNA